MARASESACRAAAISRQGDSCHYVQGISSSDLGALLAKIDVCMKMNGVVPQRLYNSRFLVSISSKQITILVAFLGNFCLNIVNFFLDLSLADPNVTANKTKKEK